MNDLEPLQGQWGQLWINGDLIQETTGFNAKYKALMKDYLTCGENTNHSVMVGKDGDGNIEMNKINSRMLKLLIDSWNKGTNPKFTLISNISSKDERGEERIALYGVQFTELDLANWKSGEFCKTSQPFKFEKAELLDSLS
ncbi:phage tail tube protein [Vallitalea guaymasensis]|uniref:phage tail tube protein n=1 Tax=Vallitalea guaymasensis TaxID=1185412 RepID=UPI000DE1BAB0|nr:phage tail tube protein [Vallitalea guaymasensis]